MSKRIDLTGRKIGKLTVIQYAGNDKGKNARWECRCDCGRRTVVAGNHLRNGHTQSCGCLQRDRASSSNTKHGGSKTRLHKTWSGMKDRCLNPNNKAYERYGGRGITICDEWRDDFQAFYGWAMSNGYSDSLTIDRVDSNGNYAPSNCRWITNKEQQNNKRNNRYLTYNGETHMVKDWAKITGLNYKTILMRIDHYNWDTERALTTPTQKVGSQCRD